MPAREIGSAFDDSPSLRRANSRPLHLPNCPPHSPGKHIKGPPELDPYFRIVLGQEALAAENILVPSELGILEPRGVDGEGGGERGKSGEIALGF